MKSVPVKRVNFYQHRLEKYGNDGNDDSSDSHPFMTMSKTCAQDIKISADEGKRLPMNFLMVKAMHDRELLVSTRTGKRKTRNSNRLGPRDRRILRRSAHYARFAAASYDGVIDTMKELAEEDILPPPDLFSKRCEEEGGGEPPFRGSVVLSRESATTK